MKRISVIAIALIALIGGYRADARTVTLEAEVHAGSISPTPPLVTGTHDVVVAIYSSSTGGSPVWYETHENVAFTSGVFSVVVGSNTSGGVPETYFDGDYYYGVTVTGIGRGELEPRGQVTDDKSTWTGFWKRVNGSASTVASIAATAFPNPFTSAITIRVDLPESALVSAAIYDIAGREVARPVTDRELAKGNNQIEWAPGNMQPGTYILRLQVDGKEQSAIPIHYIR